MRCWQLVTARYKHFGQLTLWRRAGSCRGTWRLGFNGPRHHGTHCSGILYMQAQLSLAPPIAIAIATDENEVEQAESPDESVAYNPNEVLRWVRRLESCGFDPFLVELEADGRREEVVVLRGVYLA
ncbi:hypothetical protein SO802_030772 [Lithocarpus litseifolius]|uniref:Uncharacterized protein n=1 Tax=Lithocarpus litseifolius TaxID=425828 RepID=A0AAW2BIR4_9ROSI